MIVYVKKQEREEYNETYTTILGIFDKEHMIIDKNSYFDTYTKVIQQQKHRLTEEIKAIKTTREALITLDNKDLLPKQKNLIERRKDRLEGTNRNSDIAQYLLANITKELNEVRKKRRDILQKITDLTNEISDKQNKLDKLNKDITDEEKEVDFICWLDCTFHISYEEYSLNACEDGTPLED